MSSLEIRTSYSVSLSHQLDSHLMILTKSFPLLHLTQSNTNASAWDYCSHFQQIFTLALLDVLQYTLYNL